MAVSSAVWVIMRERLCEACSCFNAQRKVAICDVFIFRQMHSWWVAFCFMICLNESKVLSHSFIDSFMSEPVELLRIFFFCTEILTDLWLLWSWSGGFVFICQTNEKATKKSNTLYSLIICLFFPHHWFLFLWSVTNTAAPKSQCRTERCDTAQSKQIIHKYRK